jgi:hypothetical protein
MLDYKTQSQIVDATASVMRWYVTAAISTSAASAWRGLSLWSELMDATRAVGAAGTSPAAPTVAGDQAARSELAVWPWLPAKISSTSPLSRAWWLGPRLTWWAPLAGWAALGCAKSPATPPAAGVRSNGAAQPAADSGVASYRSSSGHAVAQVIMGAPPAKRTNGHASPASSS